MTINNYTRVWFQLQNKQTDRHDNTQKVNIK